MASLTKHTTDGSSKLIQLLRNRGYIDMVSSKLGGKECFLAHYGAPGTLFRQHILARWWELMVGAQTNVFPVQSPLLENSNLKTNKLPQSIRSSLQKDCASKYSQVLKLTNGKLPISIASIGSCVSIDYNLPKDSEEDERSFLLGSVLRTTMTLQNYLPPSNVHAIQDYWLRTRLTWWKKYSRNPERFSVLSGPDHRNNTTGEEMNGNTTRHHTDNTNSNSESKASSSHMNIVYEFPWGQEVVETVNNLGDRLFRQMDTDESKGFLIKGAGKKSVFPACIECDTSVESAMAAWLVDGYHEKYLCNPTAKKKDNSQKLNQVLRLHPQLCPYQVAIVMATPSSLASSGNEMRYICNHLEQNLKRAGISVFNTSHHGGTLDAHFRRNDQLGIMYTVIINQSTVTDGVVNTRSRDTQVKVSTHISSLILELSRNLNAQLE